MEEFVGIGQLQIKQPGAHESDPRGYNQIWSNGLTKRELFAAMVMQNLASRPELFNLEEALSRSIQCADALMQGLKK